MTKIIKKVRASHDGASIIVIDKTTNEDIEASYQIKEPPHPDLVNSLQALQPVVKSICNVGKAWDKLDLVVTGVSFSYRNDREAAVITSKLFVEGSNSTLNISTPLKNFSIEEVEEQETSFTDDEVALLEKVRTEAQACLDGKRSQGDLLHEAA